MANKLVMALKEIKDGGSPFKIENGEGASLAFKCDRDKDPNGKKGHAFKLKYKLKL